VKTSLATPYAAQLRVYEPVATLSPAARRRWETYAASPDRPGRAELMARELRQQRAGILSTPPVVVPAMESLDAFVLVVAGVTYVCPVQTRLRSWAALAALRADLPELLVGAFVPPAVIERAEQDQLRWRLEPPDDKDERLHIVTETWTVPLHWFVPFSPAERDLVLPGADDVTGPVGERSPGDGPGRSLTYRTPMARARRRVALALRTLRRTLVDGPVVTGVEDLGRWLEDFHPRSWLELDYAGLVHLQDAEQLMQDQSARDVAQALHALEEDRTEEASAAYVRLVERWRKVAALEHAN
jgi:hypothetical protein